MTRPATRIAALLALLLATSTGCAPGGSQPDPLPSTCADLLFIGVRGSGESGSADHALGSTLSDLYNRLKTHHPELTTGAYGLPYAARTTSGNTVGDAADRLGSTVRQRERQCPHERLVLAGFSLGAWILGDALQRSGTPAADPTVVAAAVLGDPRFNPADSATAASSFDRRHHSDRPRPPYPRQLASKIRSICRSRDAICQGDDPLADKAQHNHYVPEQTCQALAFIEGAAHFTRTDENTCTTP
jgi:hypothetical protein